MLHRNSLHQQLSQAVQPLATIAPNPNDGGLYLAAAQPQHRTPHAAHPFVHHAGLPHAQNGYPGVYQEIDARFHLIHGTQQQQQQQLHAPLPPTPLHRAYEAGPPADGVQPAAVASHGQFEGLRLIPSPPDLEEWRRKLFHVDSTITLTEEQFQTYFPHVDNIYSHRSTQRHKRKRFVSHYWDCRLKGRPPGTKKSTDPDKKKRKRVARERNLCDVKIKITEYFDGAELTEQTGQQPPLDAAMDGDVFFPQSSMPAQAQMSPWGMPPMSSGIPMAPAVPRKFYTLQRVNGNGGNGKGDGVPGPHKHSLEESDKVKKNSVVRWMMRNDKEKKKAQGGDPSKKTYHKKATGAALVTVKNHSKEEDLKLYGSCFCPFVQRAWISLEYKNIPYQYIEIDPYKKPQALLDVNPRGLVPAIRHGPTWSVHESTVIMEYLEDLNAGPALLPPDAQTRATCRLWTDHINRIIVPCFYRLIQAQDPNDQVNHATELRDGIEKLVNAADPEGPFFLGRNLGFVDVQIAPWVVRLKKVLGPYRGWPEPEAGSRWEKWVTAIENAPSVKSTTSDDALYLDSYERYAENRPNTSQVANAVNSGRGLP